MSKPELDGKRLKTSQARQLLTGSGKPYFAFSITFIKDIIFALKYRNNYVKLFRKGRKMIFLSRTKTRIISLTRLGDISSGSSITTTIYKVTFQLQSKINTLVSTQYSKSYQPIQYTGHPSNNYNRDITLFKMTFRGLTFEMFHRFNVKIKNDLF